MDRLDFALFRELGRNPNLVWSAPGYRVSPPRLARGLKVDATTVRARLKKWTDRGFLVRMDVLPNPTTLGAPLAAGGVRAQSPAARARLVDALADVPGILHAIEYVGPWIGFSCVGTDRELARMANVVSNLKGAAEVQAPFHVQSPRSSWLPNATGWRVLTALTHPEPRPIRDAAKAARVSLNTFHRHAEELSSTGGVVSMPSFDFRRYEGAILARLFVELAPDSDARAVERLVEAELDDETVLERAKAERVGDVDTIALTVHAASMAALEDVEQNLRGVSGVETVEAIHPRRTHVFRAWFDERLAAAPTIAARRA